jgi:hypothetical protein
MLPNDQQAIEITCRLEGNRFSITVTDQGPAFDPLGRADPDPAAPTKPSAQSHTLRRTQIRSTIPMPTRLTRPLPKTWARCSR